MPIEQYTYWSMTINNPEENDYVLVRNPNSKYIRELVWTPEEGEEEGTPHIQAWIRMQRNQGLTFMKRLYPRASFKSCDKDQYNENVHSYAQKNDTTTRGPHTITLNDPIPSTERLIMEVIEKSVERLASDNDMAVETVLKMSGVYKQVRAESAHIENDLVREKGPNYAKVFCSPVYARLWTRYGEQLFQHYKINYNATPYVCQDSEGKESESDQDSEASEDVGSIESRSSCGSETDDQSEGGE